MSQKNKGYFLAEMLLAMSAFLMAASILLPYAMLIITQTIQLRDDTEAADILFDELMHIKTSGTESGRTLVLKDGVSYQVVVIKDDSKPFWEVCVHYDAENQQSSKKCAFIE